MTWKYMQKEDKKEKLDKTFRLELKSPNNLNYSLSVLIKKEIIRLLELKKGDFLEVHIKETDDHNIMYDMYFVSENDDDSDEENNKETDESNEEEDKEIAGVKPVIIKETDRIIFKYITNLLNIEFRKIKSGTKFIYIFDSDDKLITKKGVTNYSESEINKIIKELILCNGNTKDDVKKILDNYRSS